MKRQDLWIALALFVGLSSLYFAVSKGITSSNDGSHYALTRTLVENGTFALMQFDDYAEGNDIALVGDVLYSDRPPGNALVASLFYRAGGWFPDPLTPIPSKHDAENDRLLTVMFLPVWAGALTAVLLYLLLRQLFNIGSGVALTAVLFHALGTIHFKYSTVFFSHALSGLLVLTCIGLLLWLWKQPDWRGYGLLGGLLGLSVLVEYSNGLLVGLISLLVLWQWWQWREQKTSVAKAILAYTLLGLLSAGFLAYYNNTNFGSPFTLSYDYAINYDWAGEFGSTFNFPLREGLRNMLWFGAGDGWCNPTCFNQGFLLLSPVLGLAILGVWGMARKWPRETAVILTIFLSYLILFAKHRTSHGFTANGRYLAPFLPLLVFPLAFTLNWIKQRPPTWGTVLNLFASGLFFLSLRNMLWHIGRSFHYQLDPTQLNPLIAHPDNWRYWAEILLPNWGNLPLLWLAEVILLLFIASLGWIWQSRRRVG